jgi:uncharacterized protein with HEPN domain
MKKPTPVERIQHILSAIANIREYMDGASLEAFSKDDLLQSAVKYQFLVIGEATRAIDPSILEKYPYPWHIPMSFRNYIIHSYHGIKLDRVYFAANDMNALEEVMQTIIKKEF